MSSIKGIKEMRLSKHFQFLWDSCPNHFSGDHLSWYLQDLHLGPRPHVGALKSESAGEKVHKKLLFRPQIQIRGRKCNFLCILSPANLDLQGENVKTQVLTKGY